MTFDAWELSIRPSNDYLAHHGIRGMKHGRNRYQNEDGSWTEEGLRRRRQREGFGESKGERKAQKAVAKAEKKEARKAARAEAVETIRKKKLKNLTNEELQERIDRLKKEQEYKELKKSPYVEMGANLINKYFEYRSGKEQRAIEASKQKLEMERLKTQQIQAKNQTEQSKNRIRTSANEAKKAGFEAEKMKADVKGGLKIERKKDLKNAKLAYRNNTVWGGISKRINIALTSGKAKELESIRKAKGENQANQMRSDSNRSLQLQQRKHKEEDARYAKKREKEEIREKAKAATKAYRNRKKYATT